jgi:hypothetical protein
VAVQPPSPSDRHRDPVDLYVRVSRVGGRENLISPDEQERRGRELAAERGLTVGEVLIDLDESGGKWERPGLQDGARARRAGRVRRRDRRLARPALPRQRARARARPPHHRSRRRDLRARRARRLDDPGGRAAGRDPLRVRRLRPQARARGLRAREGAAIANGIPSTTVRRRLPPRRRPPPRARPRTAPVVRQVFEARVAAPGPSSSPSCSRRATASRRRRARSTWSKPAVYGLLRNRVYLGELSYGKDRRFVNAPRTSRSSTSRRSQLAQPASHRQPRPARAILLSGLLRCDGCRHCLHGTTDSARPPDLPVQATSRRRHLRAPGADPRRPCRGAVLADFWKHLPRCAHAAKRDESGGVSPSSRRRRANAAALAQWASPDDAGRDRRPRRLRRRTARTPPAASTAAEDALAAEQQTAATAHAFPRP